MKNTCLFLLGLAWVIAAIALVPEGEVGFWHIIAACHLVLGFTILVIAALKIRI